ncbi:multidrug efflux system protein EmrA [Serratia fonticola]|uniref:Multidrug efflux system protein EmrA n=1 Tax=Serratia fonticola TaxID=47917 RepID=A0A4U9TSM3_SERFO|nr:multidrug efflux system protein EmrA [Serratia fonticola]
MGAGAFSKEDLQHARNAVSSSKAALDVAIEQYRSNRILIQNSTLEQQPAILVGGRTNARSLARASTHQKFAAR